MSTATGVERLTTRSYWDQQYHGAVKPALRLEGYRNQLSAQVYRRMCRAGLDGGLAVLEVGAGDSHWLPFLAGAHPGSRFTGLDYSTPGCEQLARQAAAAGVSIDVVCADLFDPPAAMVGAFDRVLTIGVVEHFDDLPRALSALAAFLKPGGLVYTQIPNLTGPMGALCRWFDRSVYDVHNPHDLRRLVDGHVKAGFTVVEAGLIGCTEFSVLSSCINDRWTSLQWAAYKGLAAVSRVTAWWEHRVSPLPTTQALSPLTYCVARKS